MISKTRIDKRICRKRNQDLIETIKLAKKCNQIELAKKISGPISRYNSVNIDNLGDIKESKVIVVGRVLGQGDINKKMTVYALGFSEQAKEKLKKAGCEIKKIKNALEEDKPLKGVKII
jgi:large subunit ribosomal protein L18e